MILSEDALTIALAVRRFVGPDKKGVGLGVEELLTLDGVKDMPPSDIVRAFAELERYGFFGVNRGVGEHRPGTPKELRDIVSVTITETFQTLLDGME
jgi:hypothetical protein